jgi:2-polyprenyl-3-methyl-5-hydroxy-6-metoxy-1,4-benzoquinol methylase
VSAIGFISSSERPSRKVVRTIPQSILDLYKPVSFRESFYLRTRWRLCPFELIESYIPRKGRVLDFGCGYGMLSNLLAERGPARMVTGIDLNPARINVAIRTVARRPNVRFHLGNVESLAPSPFDAVVMTDVLHHIPNDQVATLLAKIYSSLGRDGTLAVLDVDRRPFWKFCITYAIDSLLNPSDRLWYRPLRRIQEMTESAGLRTEKVIPADDGLPLADVLLLCRKDRRESKGDTPPPLSPPTKRGEAQGAQEAPPLRSGTTGEGCRSTIC